jgi:5-methylthioadenosine/S-adenosylhomocysteine deaminase
VATSRDRIAAVGPADDLVARWPDAPVEDLGEAIVVPGFVDAHCHLEWSLLDGVLAPDTFGAWLGRMLEARTRMTPDDHRLAARHGALRALRAGTTTAADNGPTGAGAAAMTELGLCGTVHLETFGTPDGDRAARAARSVAAQVAALDAEAGDGVRVGLSPHAPYTVGPAFWAALEAEPSLAVRPWATHLAESLDEERVVAGGDGPLGELFARAGFAPGRWDGADDATVVSRVAAGGGLRRGMVAAHCVRLGPGDPALLRGAGVTAAHCPRSNAFLRCGTAPLAAMLAAGVRVGLGTDSPASGGDFDLRAEARDCGRRHGVPAEQLLRLATRGGAEALGAEDEVGSLAPGLRADLVSLRPTGPVRDPAEAALDESAAVHAVVSGGERLVDSGRALAPGAADLDTRAGEARKRLW